MLDHIRKLLNHWLGWPSNMKIELKNRYEIIRTIEKIEEFDLRTISINDLEEELKSLLKGFKIVVPRFNAGIYLYRGRICDKPLNLRDVIYPGAFPKQ